MCANQPGESGEAIARGVVGFCLEDRLALNRVYFSQNWEEKNKNKYSRAWGRGRQNPREPGDSSAEQPQPESVAVTICPSSKLSPEPEAEKTQSLRPAQGRRVLNIVVFAPC